MKSRWILEDDRYCIVCGEKNLRGFRLNLVKKNDEIITYLKIKKWMQGYKDIVHGGVLGLILDEMIVNACYLNGYKAVSVEYKVRLKKPCFVGEELKFCSKITEVRKNIAICYAWAIKEKDVIAEANGKCLILK